MATQMGQINGLDWRPGCRCVECSANLPSRGNLLTEVVDCIENRRNGYVLFSLKLQKDLLCNIFSIIVAHENKFQQDGVEVLLKPDQGVQGWGES